VSRLLTLLRHGEAAPAAAGGDFARMLTRRGEREAWESATQIASHSPPPSRVLASEAPRALQTATIARDATGLPSGSLVPDPALYLADVRTLLEAIAATEDSCTHLLVVGHNPGLSELVHVLAPGSAFGSLPTGGWCTLASPAGSWALLESDRARLR
jgi:phosphohistidine phosphatase